MAFTSTRGGGSGYGFQSSSYSPCSSRFESTRTKTEALPPRRRQEPAGRISYLRDHRHPRKEYSGDRTGDILDKLRDLRLDSRQDTMGSPRQRLRNHIGNPIRDYPTTWSLRSQHYLFRSSPRIRESHRSRPYQDYIPSRFQQTTSEPCNTEDTDKILRRAQTLRFKQHETKREMHSLLFRADEALRLHEKQTKRGYDLHHSDYASHRNPRETYLPRANHPQFFERSYLHPKEEIHNHRHSPEWSSQRHSRETPPYNPTYEGRSPEYSFQTPVHSKNHENQWKDLSLPCTTSSSTNSLREHESHSCHRGLGHHRLNKRLIRSPSRSKSQDIGSEESNSEEKYYGLDHLRTPKSEASFEFPKVRFDNIPRRTLDELRTSPNASDFLAEYHASPRVRLSPISKNIHIVSVEDESSMESVDTRKKSYLPVKPSKEDPDAKKERTIFAPYWMRQEEAARRQEVDSHLHARVKSGNQKVSVDYFESENGILHVEENNPTNQKGRVFINQDITFNADEEWTIETEQDADVRFSYSKDVPPKSASTKQAIVGDVEELREHNRDEEFKRMVKFQKHYLESKQKEELESTADDETFSAKSPVRIVNFSRKMGIENDYLGKPEPGDRKEEITMKKKRQSVPETIHLVGVYDPPVRSNLCDGDSTISSKTRRWVWDHVAEVEMNLLSAPTSGDGDEITNQKISTRKPLTKKPHLQVKNRDKGIATLATEATSGENCCDTLPCGLSFC